MNPYESRREGSPLENSASHDVQPGDTSRRVSLLIPEGFDYQSSSRGWFLIGLGYALSALLTCIFGLVGHVLVIMGLGYLHKIHRGAWIVIILEVFSIIPFIPLIGYYIGFFVSIAGPIGLAFMVSLESVVLGRPGIKTGTWIGVILLSGISAFPYIGILEYLFNLDIMRYFDYLYAGLFAGNFLVRGYLGYIFIKMSRLLRRLGEVNAVSISANANG